MDDRVRGAGDAAARRIVELDARRQRLVAGDAPTRDDVARARRAATRAAVRARHALIRSAVAHERSALAHERAARAKESLALRSAKPDADRLSAESEVHRVAAAAAYEAARSDRDLAGARMP